MLELRLSEVPEDALHRVGLLARGGRLELDDAVLDGGGLARLGIARLGGEEVGLHPLRHRAGMGIGVDGDEEVGALLVGEVGPITQRHEDIRGAAQHHLDAEPALLHHARHATGDVEHHVLFLDPGGAGGAGVMPAVAGIEDDKAEGLRGGAARRALRARALLGAVDVEHDAIGILEREVLHLPRRRVENDAQHGARARRLEAQLFHETVVDLLELGPCEPEAGEPHANLPALGGLVHDGVADGAARLQHDAGERGIRPEPQILERHRGASPRPASPPPGSRARPPPSWSRRGRGETGPWRGSPRG